MIEFLRNVFSTALKTNDALGKGVLTGCLRIAKESVFTGLNNFNVYSEETKELLESYDMISCEATVKEW